MIRVDDLITIARERLNDAQTLLDAGRYDGAAYLCGYSVEIALKHKICLTLNWNGFPSTNNEFSNYRCLKTHDLDVLLSFTGDESAIKSSRLAEWSAVGNWNPEARYNPTGGVTSADATLMINSARTLIHVL
jgi:HEPN domain-containing protein